VIRNNSEVCPFCSLFCDDLKVITSDSHGYTTIPHCDLAESKFQKLKKEAGSPEYKGDPVSFSTAFAAAKSILLAAKYLHVNISGSLSNEELRSAIRLVIKLNAVIFLPSPAYGDRFSLAVNKSGWLTATLAELRNRLDCVVLWNCSPEKTQPRLLERLGPGSSDNRLIQVMEDKIDQVQETDMGFSIPLGTSIEFLHQLRMEIKYPSDERSIYFRFMEKLRHADHGLFVFDSSLLMGGYRILQELISFFDQVNQRDCWFGIQLTQQSNDKGAADILTSALSSPTRIRYQYPDLNNESGKKADVKHPGEFDGADVILTLGDPVDPSFIRPDQVLIQIGGDRPQNPPTIYIPAGRVGVSTSGTCTRVDGVPVWLEKMFDLNLPSVKEFADRFFEELSS